MIHFGDPRLPVRFWDKVSPEPNSGCWLWMGSHNEKGYGDFWFGDRLERPHRLSYEMLVRDYPAAWLMCHRCDTPACVNPAHLFPGTALQNTTDMVRKGRHKPAPRRGAVCHAGHAMTAENTLAVGGCKACKRHNYHNRKAA